MDTGTLKPRNIKDFKGYKSLTEIKASKIRMLVRNRKPDQPDEIVAIFFLKDMTDIEKSFSKQYKRK